MIDGMTCFPLCEYEKRIEKLRAGMREQSFDAVLLGTGMNLEYFSGFPSPHKSVTRPFFLLIPSQHDPVFFTHTGYAEECSRLQSISDIRLYETLSHLPLELLTGVLTEVGADTGCIGMELGFEQSLDISLLDFRRLQNSLPAAELKDAASLLWQLRMIKSEAEIACMSQACDIVAQAYTHTFRNSRAGMQEREIYRTMLDRLHDSGGDTFLAITSGRGNYDLVSKPPSRRIVLPGDMVWMDAGCRVQGYWSDYSRAAVVGEPSDMQKRIQEAVHRLTVEAVEHVRPGKPCSEIARFALSRLEQLPFPITSSIAMRAGRIGHGIGLTMTEPPHLGLHDDTLLRPGMVVSIEPGVATEVGTYHIEEDVVVTEEGYELLSTSPRMLQRLVL